MVNTYLTEDAVHRAHHILRFTQSDPGWRRNPHHTLHPLRLCGSSCWARAGSLLRRDKPSPLP